MWRKVRKSRRYGGDFQTTCRGGQAMEIATETTLSEMFLEAVLLEALLYLNQICTGESQSVYGQYNMLTVEPLWSRSHEFPHN